MEARDIDVTLVQEPHSYKGTLSGFPSSYRVFFSHSFDIIKAAIIVRNRNISTFLDLNYLYYNMVTVRLNIKGVSYLFVSYYFKLSKNIDFDLLKVNQIFSSMPISRLVWSMDANSKSETCGPVPFPTLEALSLLNLLVLITSLSIMKFVVLHFAVLKDLATLM
ncbi:hypothetical protein TNIN_441851 [Trichonephila inaurata madagascariensis]|uniref:Uncharacterized protein n=1 Tax=Trichonephila inaurata madagascariensis TaxID=2747483 RepID=A0A8X6XLJ9_9ARAC|nr:hypothetical protein TNIN_441851 [Trichonephila inaurata madagascariensis]